MSDKELRRKRLGRFSYILTGFLFGQSAYSYLASGYTSLGLFVLFIAIVNLLPLLNLGKRKTLIEHCIRGLNIPFALLVAKSYFDGGSEYIHFMWIAIAVMYLLVFIFFLRKGPQLAS